MTKMPRPLVIACLLLASACSDAEVDPPIEDTVYAYGDWGDPFASLGRGATQNASVCARPGSDAVRDLFCSVPPASITRLADLQMALGIDTNQLRGFYGLAIAGHSTSLSTRLVSAINPRLIFIRVENSQIELLALSVTRGEQFCELMVRDRVDRELRFYLVRFEQACNAAPGGCTPGDLLTEVVEQDWQNVTLYDEASVANHVLDCATCHQPDGPGTKKLMRMQEFETPWTHWFLKGSPSGNVLIDDFFAAKGDEPLANVVKNNLEYSQPGSLSLLAQFSGYPAQPNMFDSPTIEKEVLDSAALLGGNQPLDNAVPGDSPTWRAIYERAKQGEAIPVPYHDVKVTDATKLAQLTAAYQSYRAGLLARADLPDLRDVFPDDPKLLAEMGVRTEPGLPGEAVLTQACSQCHNPRLTQDVSRARFRADLVGMSRQEKDLAITRLRLPPNNPYAMPPARLRELTPEARARAIEVLQR